MKKYILFFIVSAIGGCSVFPKTKEELISTGSPSQTYCISDERPVVEPRIEAYLVKCFHPGYVSAGNGAGFAFSPNLSKSQENGKAEFSISVPSGSAAGYFLNVVVADGDSNCKTKMSAIAYNFMWERNFSKLFESAKGGEPGCPM
ncbi:hypothetical protein ACVW0Y_004699 [Pseudomonas sp. TE3786]